jgi:glycogen synthase
VFESKVSAKRRPVYFIAQQSLFNRPISTVYDDDPYRFAVLLARGARVGRRVGLAARRRPCARLARSPRVMWLATAGRFDPGSRGTPTVFTIHNMAHQGARSRRVAPTWA